MICHTACLRKSRRGRPGLLLQVWGGLPQEFREHQVGLGWEGGPGAARLGAGGLGQLNKAVSRVTGGGKVTAARQDRVTLLEAGHKFKTVGTRKSRNPIREGVKSAGDAGRTNKSIRYRRHETGMKYRHLLNRKSLFLEGRI